jgi:hypothetical protein
VIAGDERPIDQSILSAMGEKVVMIDFVEKEERR